MKLIHCADLHLDSKMESNLGKEKAKERKGELLYTFERMINYAVDNAVQAILIAGDMFDTKTISATARNTVLKAITGHTDINFYYIKGNHDKDNFLSGVDELPDNLKLFDDTWTSYEEADSHIVITGVELSADNAMSVYNSLVLDSNKFNIVMMHGQEAEAGSKDKAEVINLKALRNRGIDYLALGHVHFYKMESLDPRATYCYPGCLEGRGFDECGDHGFVLLDIDETTKQCRKEFVPFAKRRLYEIPVDVSDCSTTADMTKKAKDCVAAAGCSTDSLIKLVLKGTVDVESDKDVDYLLTSFKDTYYFAKCYDETSLKIDIDDYMLDQSLKGEYVRQVMADTAISDSDKTKIIRYGLQVLAGEEVR